MWNPSYLLPSISRVTYSNIFGEKYFFFSYLLLIQFASKPASLPDSNEQVFTETCFVSGLMLETEDINGVQTDKVFALIELTTRGEADLMK